jgi:hypothetical protein
VRDVEVLARGQRTPQRGAHLVDGPADLDRDDLRLTGDPHGRGGAARAKARDQQLIGIERGDLRDLSVTDGDARDLLAHPHVAGTADGHLDGAIGLRAFRARVGLRVDDRGDGDRRDQRGE